MDYKLFTRLTAEIPKAFEDLKPAFQVYEANNKIPFHVVLKAPEELKQPFSVKSSNYEISAEIFPFNDGMIFETSEVIKNDTGYRYEPISELTVLFTEDIEHSNTHEIALHYSFPNKKKANKHNSLFGRDYAIAFWEYMKVKETSRFNKLTGSIET